MKKSDLLKMELDNLEKEFNAKIKKITCMSNHVSNNAGARLDSDYLHSYSQRRTHLLCDIYREENREIEVGDGVTICLYSDKHAGTVIKRTKCTLTVQRDKAIIKPEFKPDFVIGGFCAHCTNQNEQSYTYEKDPEGTVETFRWSEKNGMFQHNGIKVMKGRYEFYDYNF